MENSCDTNDDLFTKMKAHIDSVNEGTFTNIQLSPQPSCTELESAYNELCITNENYIVVKSGYPIEINNKWVCPYIIYMVQYLDKFWIVTIDGNNDFSYKAEIYTDY